MEDLLKVEATRYIFLFRDIEDLNKYVHHCLFFFIAVEMAGELLGQSPQSSLWKEGVHVMRLPVFFDYLVVEVQLAQEETIAVQRSMKFLSILEDECMTVPDHVGEQGKELNLYRKCPLFALVLYETVVFPIQCYFSPASI